MTALTDTRLIVASDIVGNPEHFAAELTLLLEAHPDADLPSLRLVEEETVGLWRWLVRIGPIVGEPECPSCHTHGTHPHTEYCQLVDHASQLTFVELYGPAVP